MAVENNKFHYTVNKVYSEISTIGGEIIKWNGPSNVQSKRPEPTFKKQRTPRPPSFVEHWEAHST